MTFSSLTVLQVLSLEDYTSLVSVKFLLILDFRVSKNYQNCKSTEMEVIDYIKQEL